MSAYFKYCIPTKHFVDRLGNILDLVGNNVVIGADVNAHSSLWHSRQSGHTGMARGTRLETLIGDKHLKVHNLPGRIDTYDRPGMGASNVDVTLTRGADMIGAVHGWDVVDVTDSDHRLIRYGISFKGEEPGHAVRKRRYNVRRANWDKFNRYLISNVHASSDALADVRDLEGVATTLTSVLERAMESSMPRSAKPGRARPPWWSRELTDSKRRLNSYRRNRDYKGEDRCEYRRLRNEHLLLIRKAKSESWKGFATGMNTDTWGGVYRWAKNGPTKGKIPCSMRRTDGTYTVTAKETAKLLLEGLIPTGDRTPVFSVDRVGRNRTDVTAAEVKRAVWRMAPNKAPGLDGVTGRVLRKAWEVVGDYLVKFYDRCIRDSYFPNVWKLADVVVIIKGDDKDPGVPKSYRPVSLLPVASKVLERLIVDRMMEEVGGTMSDDQHGFRIGKSTVSAMRACLDWVDGREEGLVLGVFLDISGAFDNLDWTSLLEDLAALRAAPSTLSMVAAYLAGRRAVLTVEGASVYADLTRGCPQGSILGPSLWNVSMDRALKSVGHDRVKVVAYADDLVVLAAGTDSLEVKNVVGETLDVLAGWARHRGLSFSVAKTKAMSMKGRFPAGFSIHFGEGTVGLENSVRYLGVELDQGRNFWAHVKSVAGKSEGLYSRLRAATSAEWGLRQSTSGVVYRAVFLPRVTYASEVWRAGLGTKRAVALLGSRQRRALLSITGAYRTTSTVALQMVAGQLPLDLEVRKNIIRKDLKAGLVSAEEAGGQIESLLDIWQDRWDSSDKGRWTYSFMPKVRERLIIPLVLDHYVTQFLTGHGDFNAKLEGFRLRATGECRCGAGPETVDHVLFECCELSESRDRLVRAVGRGGHGWPCATEVFLSTRSVYEELRIFARAAITAKRESEGK